MRVAADSRWWPFSDAQVSHLNDRCARIANVRRAELGVANAVGSDIRPEEPARPIGLI
jgi:hypothetical protein